MIVLDDAADDIQVWVHHDSSSDDVRVRLLLVFSGLIEE